MKASVKLREERAVIPQWKAKVPLTVAGIPLSSAVSVGSNCEDLALQLGTRFSAGPSCKLVYRPKKAPAGPLSLVVKAGISLWHSPKAATMEVTAEIGLSTLPSFSLKVKPSFGDFGLGKKVMESWSDGEFVPPNLFKAISLPSPTSNGAQAHTNSIPRSNSFPLLYDDEAPFETERFGREKRVRGNLESGGISGGSSVATTAAEDELKAIELFCRRIPRQHVKFGAISKGWSTYARSCAALGSRTKLVVRWALNTTTTNTSRATIVGINGLGFELTKLPYLLIDKISIESVSSSPPSPSPNPRFESSDLLGEGEGRSRHPLKDHLQCLHAENMALRRALDGEPYKHTKKDGKKDTFAANTSTTTMDFPGSIRDLTTAMTVEPNIFVDKGSSERG